MMTPRSFLLTERQARQGQRQRLHPPSAASPPAPSITTNTSCTSSSIDAPTPFIPCSPSSCIPSLLQSRPPPPPFSSSLFTSEPSYSSTFLTTSASSAVTTTSTTFTSSCWSPNYDDTQTSHNNDNNVHITITPVRPEINDTMGKRKDRQETSYLSPSSPPTTTTSLTMRPTTPTSPVKIPTNNNRFVAHPQKRHTSQRRRPRDSRSSDNLPPSLAALLAVTDIPRPKHSQHRRRSDKTLTVEVVIDCQQGCEKELSWSLSRNPMQILLSPPQDVADDYDSVSDCNIGSTVSTRTYSIDSTPSLDESFSSDCLSSLGSPRTPSPLSRRTRFTPMRKSLEPVLSPPGSIDEHPLAVGDSDEDDLDFEALRLPQQVEANKSQSLHSFKPLRSVFKSNLTASFRALKFAAKSFSSINFSSIPSDDLLTRSILTIDPNVPYADERRPPVLEDIPSEAMRRYLNPTTNSRIEGPTKAVAAGTFAASIQMRTYKIQRSRSASSSSRNSYPSTSLHSQPSPAPQQPLPQAPTQNATPGMRQREMRENPDFIRVAVMEMAMRKNGKLDDQRPGRARWALPPRQMSTKPYEVASNGVPARWIPITY